jgi:hypothetical protein
LLIEVEVIGLILFELDVIWSIFENDGLNPLANAELGGPLVTIGGLLSVVEVLSPVVYLLAV